jgi:hypothetical protein
MRAKMVGNSFGRSGTVSLDLTNWAGNVVYSADSVHYPTSVVEVQELVARRSRVKALGTRHSFNTIADSPGGALISLSELAPDITIDADAMTVSVPGGTRYDLIFDVPGNHPFRECRRVLTYNGTYVLIGHDGFRDAAGRWFGSMLRALRLLVMSSFVGQLPALNFSMPSKQDSMAVLQGSLKPGTHTARRQNVLLE